MRLSITIPTMLGIAAVAALVAIPLQRKVNAAQAEATPAVPVLVELFTSEGCSSCPPADALLVQLDKNQPVPGAHIIVLSEHVTYWNQLGWRDPFSSEANTLRQQQYGFRFNLNGVYTPQAVVDGAYETVGSDRSKLTHSIEQAASKSKTGLTINNAQWVNAALQFSVQGNTPSGSELMAALADDSVESSVARGENGGRVLHHVAAVRILQNMGSHATDGRTLSLKLPNPTSTPGTSPVRLVVFLADHHSGHVTAIAEQTLAR